MLAKVRTFVNGIRVYFRGAELKLEWAIGLLKAKDLLSLAILSVYLLIWKTHG